MTQLRPKVHIVILNWNGWKDTIECLESVSRLDYNNYQIIVCDNDSSDRSVENIQSWAEGKMHAEVDNDHPLARLTTPSIEKPIAYLALNRVEAENITLNQVNGTKLLIVQTEGNLGFAGGNNVGFRSVLSQGDSDFIWVLNNDTVVEPDSLAKMVDHSQQMLIQGQPNTCGSNVCFYDDPNVIQALGGASYNGWTGIASETLGRFTPRSQTIDHHDVTTKLDYITGCSWLLPIDFFTEIGLMEEGYFLYYEEIDWVLRSKHKYALTYAPEAYIYHKEGSSIGSKSMNKKSSLFSDFYMIKNKFRVTRRFFPLRLPSVYLFTLLQAINRVRQGDLDKAWLIIKIMFGKKQFP